MEKKILILDKANPILCDKLLEEGFQIELHTDYEREDVLQNIKDYDGIVVRSKLVLDKEILDKAERLRFIARLGAGMDAIDVDYAESKGIVCLNSPEGNRTAVGEHALGLLLCLFNKMIVADRQVRQGLWLREENRGLEIEGKTIGIIGYGNMGRSFAKRLSGFDCMVLAYDKYKKDYSDAYARESSLEEIFAQSDVLSFHVPLTEETKFMANASFFDKFSKPFYLINTSRGKVVKTKDLLEAIRAGKIKGVGLDVLEFEAFSNEFDSTSLPEELKELFLMDNVVFSPHVAGWTVESYYKLPYYLAEKIINLFK